MLDKIEENVLNMNNIVTDISEVTKSSLNEIASIKKASNEMRESLSKFNFEKFNEQANEKEDKTNKDIGNDTHGEAVIRTTNKAIIRKLSKGDLCLENLGESNLSILGGTRPVIIVQNNITNKYAPSLTVVPVTSKTTTNNNIPTHITFDWRNRTNTAVVEQITTISKNTIIDFLDEIDNEILEKIDKALLFQLCIYE